MRLLPALLLLALAGPLAAADALPAEVGVHQPGLMGTSIHSNCLIDPLSSVCVPNPWGGNDPNDPGLLCYYVYLLGLC